MLLFILSALVFSNGILANKLALSPPMGWMSWEMFRCDIDCSSNPNNCINENLYKSMTDALVSGGFLDAGYNGIHLDDCWMNLKPPRDSHGKLFPNASRFPSGMKALGDYMHAKNVSFALYTAESPQTCAGYPASANNEVLDAQTFASWGVDYLKVDGCGDESYYPEGYAKMGDALRATGRDIVYSCSWPAYLGNDESTKPFSSMIADGCNLWRNYDDIQCNWGSLAHIIDHWGDEGAVLQRFTGIGTFGGHWHDPDMLLIGNDCITDDEARTQMAIWSISAAPLIMGNDIRSIGASQRAILLNKDAIAVDQDPAGIMGTRITPKGNWEIWSRPLADGSVAVALYNKNGLDNICNDWNETLGGYFDCSAPNLGNFSGLTYQTAETNCCQLEGCVGFSFNAKDGSGYYKPDLNGGFVSNVAYVGYDRIGIALNITVSFDLVGLYQNASVRDIWLQKDLGEFDSAFTAEVPIHGTAFLLMTQAIAVLPK